MARYVVSDHHFGHSNIIEYCDRPFGSVGEMDRTLVERHFEVVDPDDVVIHLGDIAMDMRDGTEAVERLETLGVDLLVRGNHDTGLSDGQAPVPVVDSCRLSHGAYEFHCTHRPADVPASWDGWVIHGHHHDNDLDQYPLIDAAARRIHVGVDLLAFRPVSLETLTTVLDRCGPHARFRTAADLQAWSEEGVSDGGTGHRD